MIQMVPEEISLLHKRSEEEANRKRKLMAFFDQKKAENEKREQLFKAGSEVSIILVSGYLY